MAIIGNVELIAKIDTNAYLKGASDIDKANKGLEGSTQKASSGMSNAFNSVAKVGIGALIAATVAAGAAIVKNIGGAISRIDTLVAFPRVLQALGASSNEASSATERLSESLKGLPTGLGEGAKGVQQLITSGLSVDKATRGFLGFNNALLVAGTEAGAAQSTMVQFNQALSRGRIDGAEWNSIAANIPTVLQALQNETGKSKDEIRELFRENPQALLDNIIRLNEEGGGGLASLDKQARDATGGIGTAFANFDNVVQKGIQSIVEALGNGDLASGQKKISDFIASIAKLFGDALKGFGAFVKFIADNKDIVLPIIISITAFIAIITTLVTTIKLAAVTMKALNIVFSSSPVGLLIVAIAALVAGLIYFFSQTETGKQIFAGFLAFINTIFNGIITGVQLVGQSFVDLWNGIVSVFGDIGKWFSDRFNEAWGGIQRAFSGVAGFFQGIWNTITGFFTNIGSVIGNAIGGAFKGAINGVLKFAVNIINGFVDGINGVIDIVNAIPGVNLGKLGRLPIPQLATGGIVSSATLAVIGEGSEPEAVIPLSKLDAMLNNSNQPQTGGQAVVVIPNQSSAEYRQGAINTIKAYNEYLRSKSLPQIGVA